MHKLKTGRKGIKEAAKLEEGSDISAGPELNDISQLRGIKYEPDKFIVINRKHLKNSSESRIKAIQTCIDNLIGVLNYEADYPDNKYYVCNQDEPYAQKVLAVILEGEKEKERRANNARIQRNK
jgi:non-homologous end joining protein Ku